jgi:GTP-binding protein HflX|tara:strand:- start:1130 stop:2440 length:1311 start_codon:yes stop_codon:yes gene_type:complete
LKYKPDSIQRALLVYVDFKNFRVNSEYNEFCELVKSTGLEIVSTIKTTRLRADARLFIGVGKAEEIRVTAEKHDTDVVIFNRLLTPAQERNLEILFDIRVIDRIGLILDIFAQRALSYEGKLQVELAQLQHLTTRLIRGWTHLERQKGGIGLRGPGETQLETDRRLIGRRIKAIKERIQKVRKQRYQSRQQRKKQNIPVISFVGYTNAGKSTLFNYLTNANVKVEDQLFATLDPTLRRINTDNGNEIILTDTVGFIRDLPHELIESFKATLDEVKEADLLIHIIDVDQEQRQQRIDEVNQVISMIGASHVAQIEVYNKIDIHSAQKRRIEISENNKITRIWLSSRTGEGVDLLLEAMNRYLNKHKRPHYINIPVSAGQLRAKLFDIGAVKQENIDDMGGWVMRVELEEYKLHKLCKEANLDMSNITVEGCSLLTSI